jgi:hypothetical protein
MPKRAKAGGGAGGIRTLDRALQPYNGLANRRLQPLGHSSVKADMPDAGASRKRQIGGCRVPDRLNECRLLEPGGCSRPSRLKPARKRRPGARGLICGAEFGTAAADSAGAGQFRIRRSAFAAIFESVSARDLVSHRRFALTLVAQHNIQMTF